MIEEQLASKEHNEVKKMEPPQMIFENLSKLFRETEWEGMDIVIPNFNIRIVSPYKPGKERWI